MKPRKVLSLLVALMMMVQILPLSLFANDYETTETVTEYVTYDSSSSLDNDELFESYIESEIFGITTTDSIVANATVGGETYLTGLNLDVYESLIPYIQSIASGDLTSTVFSFSLTYACSDFNGSTLSEAWENVKTEFDSSTIYKYLLNDYPYDLYWHDKTTGTHISYTASGDSSTITVTFTYTFYVASGYQDGSNTTVSSTKVNTAKSAAAYAQSIATSYMAQYSTAEELYTAFKDFICSAVTYEHSYSSYDYGDVWQLVYVFDQNSSTNVVCEGYAKAFQYLCDLAGINCITVSGTLTGGTGSGNHMWNVVELCGVNYLVDVTNIDSGTIGYSTQALFLAGTDSSYITSSSSTGYAFKINSTTVTYVYNANTQALYPTSYLTLGSSANSVHTYVGVETTAATCTTDGLMTYTCSGCGDSYTETITATGHETEIQNAFDATCTEDGYTGDEVCTICGETITTGEVISATGHSYENGVCTVCGATDPSIYGTVTVGNVTLTDGQYTTNGTVVITGDPEENGASIYAYFSEGTLYLNNLTLTVTGFDGITFDGDLPIVVTGTNTITVTNSEYGIYATGDLDISGGGALSVSVDYDFYNDLVVAIFSEEGSISISDVTLVAEATNDAIWGYDYAITSYGDIIIENSTVTATATADGDEGQANALCAYNGNVSINASDVTATANANGTTEYTYAGAIYADSDIIISNSSSVTATATSVYNSSAIYAEESLTISNSTKVEATATATGTDGWAVAIETCYDEINITSTPVNVTATASGDNGDALGIYSGGDLNISQSEVTANTTADSTYGNSYAIWSDFSTTIENGSTIIAVSTGNESYAVDTYDDMTIDNSTVTATANSTSGISRAIDAYEGSLTIQNGSTVNATASGDDVIAVYGDTALNVTDSEVVADGGMSSGGEITVTATDAALEITTTVSGTDSTDTVDANDSGTDYDWSNASSVTILYVVSHTYGEPVFTWESDYSAATATFTCTDADCPHIASAGSAYSKTVDAEVTSVTTNATCTEDGSIVYTATVVFEGTTYTEDQTVTIDATGHTTEIQNAKVATCTEDGYTGDEVCTVCGETITTGEVIPATGHSYGTPTFTWTTDYSSATATFKCSVCDYEVTVDAEISSETTTAATCTTDGEITYTATAELDDTPYTDTKTVTITSTGHSYYISDHTTASDYSTITSVTLTCSKCGATSGALTPDSVTIDSTEAATCTEDGSIDFVVTVTYNGTEIVSHITEAISATGHSYGTPTFNWATDYSTCTATFTCSVCGNEEEVEADIESSGTEATCTSAGTMTYTATVTFSGTEYTDTQSSVTVPATGHTYGDPTFAWATDYSSCTTTFECTSGDDTQTVSAVVDSYATTATCTEDGFITYTATVTFNGIDYTDIQTVTTTAATGHTYGMPTFNWATDYSTCTATFECTSGDDTQVVEATVTDAVTTDPTCTTDGVRTYTATVTFNGTDYTNTQTEAIAATGHTLKVTKWNWTWNEISQTYDVTATIECSEGDYSTTQEALVESNITNATCTTAGSIVYTATVNLNGSPDSDTFTATIPATGHTYSGPTWSWDTSDYTATATFTCTSGDDTQVVDATVTDAVTTAATCTTAGVRTYTATVTFNGTEYTDTCEAEIAATGHDYGEPSWTWTGYTAATATFTCANDSTHVETETATIESSTTDATCTEDGETVYTATVTFNGETYTSTQTETIPATGHTESTAVTENNVAPTCTEDGSYDTVIYCSVCGEEISRVTTTVPATGHTESTAVTENNVAPTCTEDGSYDTVIYCSVCGEEISRETTTVPATGHNYVDGVCTECGAKTGTSGTSSSVTVSNTDKIAEVLPSGLVTSVEVTVSNIDSGAVIISEVVESTAEPHLVGHIAVDTLGFTLYNSSQEDDLISSTSSFNITTTESNKTVIKKVSVLFYGDIDYTGQGTSTVTMEFTGSDLSASTIYVLHYTGTYPEWETVTHTVTTSGTTTTIEFETDSFSPYVILSVANVSSGGSTILDLLLRINADYSAVTEAIARASALNPDDYVDFTAVTEAINAVNWDLKALYQSVVTSYAEAINEAIDNLVAATVDEEVNIDEPIEGTDTVTEEDSELEEAEAVASEPETNPTTGITIALLPMAIAALAAASSKRR